MRPLPKTGINYNAPQSIATEGFAIERQVSAGRLLGISISRLDPFFEFFVFSSHWLGRTLCGPDSPLTHHSACLEPGPSWTSSISPNIWFAFHGDLGTRLVSIHTLPVTEGSVMKRFIALTAVVLLAGTSSGCCCLGPLFGMPYGGYGGGGCQPCGGGAYGGAYSYPNSPCGPGGCGGAYAPNGVPAAYNGAVYQTGMYPAPMQAAMLNPLPAL